MSLSLGQAFQEELTKATTIKSNPSCGYHLVLASWFRFLLPNCHGPRTPVNGSIPAPFRTFQNENEMSNPTATTAGNKATRSNHCTCSLRPSPLHCSLLRCHSLHHHEIVPLRRPNIHHKCHPSRPRPRLRRLPLVSSGLVRNLHQPLRLHRSCLPL